MARFFDRRDPWGNGVALWVVAGMLMLAPLAWSSVKKIHLKNDVENWLPGDDPKAKTLAWYRDHFAVENRILISWKGSSLDDPRVEQLNARLEGHESDEGIRRGGLPQIRSVVTPHEIIERMTQHRVERDEAVERLRGVLIGSGMLKVRLAADADRQAAITNIVKRVRSQFDLDVQVIERDILVANIATDEDEFAADEDDFDEFQSSAPTASQDRETEHFDFQLTWPQMHGHPRQLQQVQQYVTQIRGPPSEGFPRGKPLVDDAFFAAGAPVAVSVALSEAGAADARGTLAAIRQVAVEVGIPEDDLAMGGRTVAGSALNRQVKAAAWNRDASLLRLDQRSIILFAAFVAVVLSFIMLRSVRLAILVIVVSLYTTFLALAMVPVTNGSMNMVLVVMPTLLSVLTISAAIHVANYWKHAAGISLRTAVVDAMQMARQPCLLASVTTSIGLISLSTSPLAPVRDFGIYSAVGCLIGLVVVLFGLPALLQFWPARAPKQPPIDRTIWYRLGGYLSRFRTPVIVTSLVVSGFCTYGLTWFRTETKVIRYFPDHSRVVRDYRFLEDNLAGIVPVDTVIRFNANAVERLSFLERLELVREVQQRMRAHPEISGTMSLADFQPVSTRPDESASTIQKMRYHRRSHQTEARVKSSESAGAGAFLSHAKAPADLRDGTQGFLSEPGDELWRVTAQVSILSDSNYGSLTDDLDAIARGVLQAESGTGHVVTGTVPLFLRTQQAVLESLIHSFALAFGMIAIVMIVLLRNPAAGLISMLPNVLPVGVVFGLISWYRISVDIGTMITASVALGIAVDGTLHLITWFRNSLRNGSSRHEAVSQALAHCGPAMWQTSTAVGIGLLMLYPADLLLVSRFGWLMAALIGAALLSDLILLPALLAGPLGALLEWQETRRQQTSTTDRSRTTRRSSPHELQPRDRLLSTPYPESRPGDTVDSAGWAETREPKFIHRQ